MQILLATSNPHKRDEILAIFADCVSQRGDHVVLPQLVTLDELGAPIDEPIEDGPTFEANALIKARHYAQASGMLTLADDSGLEVDALKGEPGVRSARYAGVQGPRDRVDPANNRQLLRCLGHTPADRRTARFVCAMALVDLRDIEAQPLALLRGTVEGRILMLDEVDDPDHPDRGRGENGFGYDPLFLLPERGITAAELSPAEKNAISHRGHAARKLFAELQRLDLLKGG